MDILIDARGYVIAFAPYVEYGVFDESFEKWALFDSEDVETRHVLLYVIDHDYTLVENVEFPEDYADGKYIYENGEFVLNEDWKPYVSIEEKVAMLEEQLANLGGDAVWDEIAVAIEEGVNEV